MAVRDIEKITITLVAKRNFFLRKTPCGDIKIVSMDT